MSSGLPARVRLETGRLILRPFVDDDLDDYAAICADPEVMRFLHGPPMTRAEAWQHMARMLGHWMLRGFGIWAVQERESGRLVGRLGFIQPEGWPGFELGWTLGRPYWGRGFATEGARAALEHAFGEMGRDHVISLIDPENARSIAVAERLGETLEGETEVLGKRVRVYGIRRGGAA